MKRNPVTPSQRAIRLVTLTLSAWLGFAGLAAALEYQVGDRLQVQPSTPTERYPEIQWDDLMPKSWDPEATFKGIDLSRLQDGDPRAQKALDRLRAAWDKAPAVQELNGRAVRLAGFIIPLERKGDMVTELLLVPYFGACIHTPPPPANQTVHVVLGKPARGLRMMDAYWINGTLRVARGDSGVGTYGYRMKADFLERYPLK